MAAILAHIASQPLSPFSGLGPELGRLFREAEGSPEPDPYQPERHYMRGPGPKWRERHPHG
jgi:hypothetical protein